MATLERYTARKGLDAGSAPDTNVSNALASAVQGLGSAISDAGEAYQSRSQKREDFRVQNDYRRMQLELTDELNQRAETMEPGGEGFTKGFINDVYNPKRDAFLASVPDRLRERFATTLATETGEDWTRWTNDAASKERDEMYRWAGERVGVTQQQLAAAIEINPDQYDDLLQAGFEDIDSAPLPTVQRQKMRQEWETMAQVAHLNRLLESDPENVIKQLGADPRYLSPTTQYDVLEKALIRQESGGRADAVSPKGAVGLMQVMPGTARDIAKEIKDPNFNPRWDPAQVSEYISNPAVNKRYGSFYLKKQIREFGGDLEAALIAYNGGPGRAREWLKANRDDSVLPDETRKYYKAITSQLPGSGNPAPGSPERAKFVWVRDGGMAALVPGDRNLEAVNKDLRDRVATAFTASGVDTIKIRSGYRDTKHNARVGGASKSQHIHGNAMDIDVAGMPIQKRLEIIRSLSANGVTGIGVYANTIHADLGGRRAWGPSHGDDSIPKWAADAIKEHMAGTAVPSRVSGRYASLPYEQRQRFIQSADQAITQRYNQTSKATAVQRVELKRAMDNELASIAATGQSTGFDDTAIATVLGEDDYVKWADSKAKSQRMFTAKDGIINMTSDEMEERLLDYKARPGSINFAADQEVEAAVQKEVERVTKLRSSRPDQAALEFPEVKDAYAEVQQSMATGSPDPDSVQRLVKLMLEKQSEFNIAPDTRAPIPRPWALEIGQSLTRVPELAGRNAEEVRAAIAVQYLSMQQFFGDMTDEVIIYALREYKGISKDQGEYITALMQSIGNGGDPLKLNPDRVADMEQMEEASGRSWFQSVTDWMGLGGEEPEEAVPAPVDDAPPSPETIIRIIGQLDPDDPSVEPSLVSRYGQKAVDAAKAKYEAGRQ